MNSIKCHSCGLAHFADDNECHRCGASLIGTFITASKKPASRRPRRFSIVSLVFYGALAMGGYHLYMGTLDSVTQAGADDAVRVGPRPTPRVQTAALSRTEQDRRHAGNVGTKIKENPAIVEHQRHNDETERMLRETTDGAAR